jgi:hypothetical protein
MEELISKKKAIEMLEGAQIHITGMRFGKTILNDYATKCRENLVNVVRDMPCEDAEHVRHGIWILVGKTEHGSNILKCSDCGRERKGSGRSSYCRDCGCKMDLLLEDQEGMFDGTVEIGELI